MATLHNTVRERVQSIHSIREYSRLVGTQQRFADSTVDRAGESPWEMASLVVVSWARLNPLSSLDIVAVYEPFADVPVLQ